MELRRRSAVSTYLEVFVLVGVASGASALVFSMVGKYGASSQGAAVMVTYVSIKQGLNEAVVKLVVENTGSVPFSSFTVSIQGIPAAQFYVSLVNVGTGLTVSPSPASGTSPASVTESVSVPPGQSLAVTIVIVSGTEFTAGSRYSLIVSTSAAAQQQVFAVAVPA